MTKQIAWFTSTRGVYHWSFEGDWSPKAPMATMEPRNFFPQKTQLSVFYELFVSNSHFAKVTITPSHHCCSGQCRQLTCMLSWLETEVEYLCWQQWKIWIWRFVFIAMKTLRLLIRRLLRRRATRLKKIESKNVHMECVQISNKGRVKKWGKSTKIWGNFKLQYIKLETSFWQTFKG